PLREVIEGKRLVVIDDSIVRGNTQRAVVRMLREAGAAEVHVRISSPPVRWPCFYGIDFATRAELIANGLEIEEIARSLGADSLGYISEDGMIAASGQPEENLCTACFSGKYPLPLPEATARSQGIVTHHDTCSATAMQDSCPTACPTPTRPTPTPRPQPAPPASPTPPPVWTPQPATVPWS